MGFQRGRRTYKLYFDENTEFEGLEFRTNGVTIEQAAWLAGPATSAELAEWFGQHLLEWNYEDENGEPLPPTWESVKQLDADVANTMALSWLHEVAGVRRPLGKPSSNGALTLPPDGLPPMAMMPTGANSTESTPPNEQPPPES